MAALGLSTQTVSGLTAGVLLAAALSGACATKPPTYGVRTLFQCRTRQRIELQPLSDGAGKTYAAGARQAVNGQVRLTFNVQDRAMRLYVQSGRDRGRTYILTNVEQVNSPTSGASGQADTTIRGESGGSVFTLTAGYATQADESSAALLIKEHTAFLLVCSRDYLAPSFQGAGGRGSIGIFHLNADGLAKKLEGLPMGVPDWVDLLPPS